MKKKHNLEMKKEVLLKKTTVFKKGTDIQNSAKKEKNSMDSNKSLLDYIGDSMFCSAIKDPFFV